MNDVSNGAPQPFTFADTSSMTPDAARAEQGRTLTDPQFQRLLNGGGAAAREQALTYLENLGKRQTAGSGQSFGKPGVTAQDFKDDPDAQAALSGKLGGEEQMNARRQLADVERMEALAGEKLSDQDVVALNKLHTPDGPNAYLSVPGLSYGVELADEARQILFDHGISPMAVAQLADTIPAAAAMDDAQFDKAVDRSRDTVLRWPGGAEIIADAVKFLNHLSDGHPLLRLAIAATTDPRGVAEMARMYRSGKGARRAS